MARTNCEECGGEAEATGVNCPACGTAFAGLAPGLPSAQNEIKQCAVKGVFINAVRMLAVLVLVLLEANCKPAAPALQVPDKVDLADLHARAEKGDPQAQSGLGKAYAKGEGVSQSYTEAAKWYRQAAEQGNAPAQAALGELHEAGQGVPQADADAAKWYRRAAEQGFAPAQYNLAVMCLMGKGVPQSVAEALKWYRKAAEQGNALAQFNIGMRYSEGNAVQADPVEAYMWLSLAAAQGIPDATKARTDLKARMNRQQVSEAEQRVRSFKPVATAKPAQ